jgi:hypothetical protein
MPHGTDAAHERLPQPVCIGCGALLDLRFAFCDADCEDRWRLARCDTLTARPSLTFSRPSRHDGVRHDILIDRDTLALADTAYPCTCLAGQRGYACWAVLEVLGVECIELACLRVIKSGRLYGPVSRQREDAEKLLNDVWTRWQTRLKQTSSASSAQRGG